MGKRILSVLLLLALLLGGMTAPSNAQESTEVQITVNGTPVVFDGDLGAPYIDENGRTMVPFRAVANVMENVIIQWEGYAKEARFGRDDLVTLEDGTEALAARLAGFPVGTAEMLLSVTVMDLESAADPNRSADAAERRFRLIDMDTQSVIRDGRTYAPIRYLAEALGYTVGWDADTRTVILEDPEPGRWEGYADWTAENLTAVGSAEEAERYARAAVRAFGGDREPKVTALGTEEMPFGTAWVFKCGFIRYDLGSGETGDEGIPSYIYDMGQFYVTEGGEIWYWLLSTGDETPVRF